MFYSPQLFSQLRAFLQIRALEALICKKKAKIQFFVVVYPSWAGQVCEVYITTKNCIFDDDWLEYYRPYSRQVD